MSPSAATSIEANSSSSRNARFITLSPMLENAGAEGASELTSPIADTFPVCTNKPIRCQINFRVNVNERIKLILTLCSKRSRRQSFNSCCAFVGLFFCIGGECLLCHVDLPLILVSIRCRKTGRHMRVGGKVGLRKVTLRWALAIAVREPTKCDHTN